MNPSDELLKFSRAASDRLMLGVCGGYTLISLVIAGVLGAWFPVLGVMLPTLVLCAFLVRTASGALLTRLALASAAMILVAAQIQQTRGMLEIHFGVFVGLAFLLVYRDWRPLVAGAATIAVHHLGFYVLQSMDFGVFVFPTADHVWRVAVHATFVVAETAVLVVLAERLRREAVDVHAISQVAAAVARGDFDGLGTIDPAKASAGLRAMLATGERFRSALAELQATAQGIREASSRLAEMTAGLDIRAGQTLGVAATLSHTSAGLDDPLTGVMHEYEVNLEGESWQHGPLILSWQDLEHDLRHPSGQQNVLIHELAHKLDALDGVMDGRPPLHPQMSGDAWAKVFSAAYADLSQRHQAGERCPIDPYGAQEPEEFFAVCCETYFTAPDVLRQAYPEVAAQMDQFFRGGGPSGHASGPASGQRSGRSSGRSSGSDAGSNSDW